MSRHYHDDECVAGALESIDDTLVSILTQLERIANDLERRAVPRLNEALTAPWKDGQPVPSRPDPGRVQS